MSGKWMKIWGNSAQRGCLIQLLAVAIVIPLFGACILVPLFFANRPGVGKTEMLLILVIPMGLFLLALLGGSLGFLFWSMRRRAAWMDEIFAPFGLVGSSYALTGRQYHGKVRGRKADVLFTRGPMLSIYLSTDVFTRAAFGNPQDVSTGLAKAFNKTPLDWGGDELTIFSHEDEWGRSFISQPEVQAALKDLILDESPFFIQQVLLEPGYLMLRLYRSKAMFDFKIPPEQGKRWVDRLVWLAELAERQPAPKESLPASALTQNLRQGKAAKWGWLIVGIIMLLTLCMGVLSALLIFMLENGL